MNTTYCVIAVLVLVAGAYLAYQYMQFRVREEKRFGDFFKPVFDVKNLIVCVAGMAVGLAFFAKGYCFGDDGYIRALMNGCTFLWLAVIGYIDLKEKVIPNPLIVVGILGWLVLVLLDIFVAHTNWRSVLAFSLIGGFVCGGVLCAVSLIAKSALGMGDAKMFFVLGLMYGLSDTYSMLLFSMLPMALWCVGLLVMKKATAKTSVPMAPFVVIGFTLSILAGM